MASADVVGTWFPSGYYGHFRSKTRNDIIQNYRHEATPLPPQQFIRWVRKSPDTHRFSKHDNRHSFPTDASYFDTGMGRRKANRSMTAFKPEFIAWMPHKEDIARQGSAVSLYRLDFRPGGVKSQETLPQRVSPRIRRKMADMETNDARLKWISDYKKHYCHGQPDYRINTDISTGQVSDRCDVTRTHQYVNKTGKLAKVVPNYLASVRRRTKSAPPIRYSVGDCLVWNQAPVSAPVQQHDSTLTNEKYKQTELTPRPPTGRRPTESIYSPRVPNHKTSAKIETKNMTPAATAISTFSPMKSQGNGKDIDVSCSTAPFSPPPTVVVD